MVAGQLSEGTLLNGRYRIKRVLGKGGMGTVYLAEHERLETVLAVKEVRVLNDDGDESHEAVEQYAHEARFLVRLNHPNLPKVNDAFIEEDRFTWSWSILKASPWMHASKRSVRTLWQFHR